MEKTRLLKMLQEPDPKYEEIQEYLIRSISYIFLKKKKKIRLLSHFSRV